MKKVKKLKQDKDQTVVELSRRKIAGVQWSAAEAGNLIGHWYLKGYISEAQKSVAYELRNYQARYLASIDAPKVKTTSFTEGTCVSVGDDYDLFVAHKYKHMLTVLQNVGGKVFVHTMRAVNNKEANLDLARVGLDALIRYRFKGVR